MRKLQKAAVLVAILGSVSLLGFGTANAAGGRQGGKGDGGFNIRQGSQCRSHDENVNVLGEVGILDGALGDALGGEGSPGAQNTTMGSNIGCNDSFALGGKGDKE
ncbi:hypothetical protein ABT168_13325 [Streptomyces sp. NPDC001793]|uniref:hypothetical protein n=1 Tax=Streptomyces sp. NPDC001793 TaxID=3154657 RepID=UPI003327AECD